MNSKNLQLLSRVMDYVRWPLIVLVVFIHSIPEPPIPVYFSFEGGNLYYFVTELISHNLGRVAVPTFFFISGYFFFFKQPDTYSLSDYAANLRKKARTLILPYLAWNFIYLGLIWAKIALGSRLGIAVYDYEVEAVGRPVWEHLTNSLNYPLWYLRDLICMNLIAPLIYLLARYLRLWGVLLLWLGYQLCLLPEQTGFSSTAIFYVSLGAYCGMYRYDILSLTYRLRYIIGTVFLVLLLISPFCNEASWSEYLIRLYIPLGLVTALQLGRCAVEPSVCREREGGVYTFLLGSVFFVYATHTVYIINWVIAGLGKLGMNDGALRLVPYFLTPIITILACLAAYQIMRSLCPRILALLTGGRS